MDCNGLKFKMPKVSRLENHKRLIRKGLLHFLCAVSRLEIWVLIETIGLPLRSVGSAFGIVGGATAKCSNWAFSEARYSGANVERCPFAGRFGARGILCRGSRRAFGRLEDELDLLELCRSAAGRGRRLESLCARLKIGLESGCRRRTGVLKRGIRLYRRLDLSFGLSWKFHSSSGLARIREIARASGGELQAACNRLACAESANQIQQRGGIIGRLEQREAIIQANALGIDSQLLEGLIEMGELLLLTERGRR